MNNPGDSAITLCVYSVGVINLAIVSVLALCIYANTLRDCGFTRHNSQCTSQSLLLPKHPSCHPRVTLPMLLFFFILAGAAAGVPAKAYMRGVDISHYQNAIGWEPLVNTGISFACAKATEGQTFVDPMFATYWLAMKQANLTRCAYHFAHPGKPASDQADHFVQVVNAAGGYADGMTLQFMLDLEVTDGAAPEAMQQWIGQFVARLKELTGRPAIIYTYYYFWNTYVQSNNDYGSPLWIASYTGSPPAKIPAPWAKLGWTFWQYSAHGAPYPGANASLVPGVVGPVDMDVFRYDSATLAKFCIPAAQP